MNLRDMKSVKLMFMAMEAGLIIGLALFMWSLQEKGTIEFVEALLTFMMALGAVTFQREQQSIEWDDEE
jgi:NADH:ubiquinone oxidoreductase subunit 3 (subunit A)